MINLVENEKSWVDQFRIFSIRENQFFYYKIVTPQISSWKICGKHQLCYLYGGLSFQGTLSQQILSDPALDGTMAIYVVSSL